MGRRGSIISFIIDNAPLEILFIFILAFIYNLNHGGIFGAIKATVFGIFGIACAAAIVVYVIATLVWHEKMHILGEWIMDRITGKKR
jgi:hypothetical protein